MGNMSIIFNLIRYFEAKLCTSNGSTSYSSFRHLIRMVILMRRYCDAFSMLRMEERLRGAARGRVELTAGYGGGKALGRETEGVKSGGGVALYLSGI